MCGSSLVASTAGSRSSRKLLYLKPCSMFYVLCAHMSRVASLFFFFFSDCLSGVDVERKCSLKCPLTHISCCHGGFGVG